MKKSEKILIALFALVFLVIVGGGVGSMALKNYQAVKAETESLTERLQKMSTTIAQADEWQRRSDWVDAHVPSFSSHEAATSKLLQELDKQASAAGLAIATKEPLPKRVVQEGESLGYFDQASVKLTLTDADEQKLFTWMHTLYAQKSFMGITRLSLSPNPQGKTVNCEIDVTQFYREATPPKLSKAN